WIFRPHSYRALRLLARARSGWCSAPARLCGCPECSAGRAALNDAWYRAWLRPPFSGQHHDEKRDTHQCRDDAYRYLDVLAQLLRAHRRAQKYEGADAGAAW